MKEKIVLTLFYLLTVIATVLGIYSQQITSYLADGDGFTTLLLIISVSSACYFIPFIITIMMVLKQKPKRNSTFSFLVINVMAGTLVSMWSLFVLFMWIG